MQTRAQASNARQSPPERLDPLVRPNAWRMRDMVQDSTLGMEERIAALEANDVLTNSHWQSVICISKMLKTTGMWSKFKDYNYKIVAAIEMDESAREEHVFRNEHQWKTLEFVNHLGDLHMKPILPKPHKCPGQPRTVLWCLSVQECFLVFPRMSHVYLG